MTHSFLKRSQHNRQHPFSIISHSLLRDNSVSLDARGLMGLFLTYDINWHISIPYFIKTQKISKNKMYRLLNELMAAGYIMRNIYFENGMKRFEYVISEFKEFLPCPQNQDTENQDPENEDSKNINTSKDVEEYQPKYSASAEAFASFFFEKLKEISPKLGKKNLTTWAKHIEAGIKRDNRSIEELKSVINFLVKESKEAPAKFKWCKVVKSPEKLFEHFASIWDKMQEPSFSNVVNTEENKVLAKVICDKAIKLAEKTSGTQRIESTHDKIFFISGQKYTEIMFNDKDFKEKLKKEIQPYQNLGKMDYERVR